MQKLRCRPYPCYLNGAAQQQGKVNSKPKGQLLRTEFWQTLGRADTSASTASAHTQSAFRSTRTLTIHRSVGGGIYCYLNPGYPLFTGVLQKKSTSAFVEYICRVCSQKRRIDKRAWQDTLRPSCKYSALLPRPDPKKETMPSAPHTARHHRPETPKHSTVCLPDSLSHR
jgi:hypothetical protein